MQLNVLTGRDIASVSEDDFVAALAAAPAVRTWSQLDSVTGGLSAPSKMPSRAWSISAKICRTGSQLRKVKGSVCSGCYALKGRYVFKNVEAAMQRRLDRLKSDPIAWAVGMVQSIRKSGDTHFRWHDSGDLLGVNHYKLICLVAKYTPEVSHWLPTREKQYVSGITPPSNLVVRLSAAMVGVAYTNNEHPHTSSVSAGVGFPCHAPDNDGKCGSCRACWSSSISNVDYRKH